MKKVSKIISLAAAVMTLSSVSFYSFYNDSVNDNLAKGKVEKKNHNTKQILTWDLKNLKKVSNKVLSGISLPSAVAQDQSAQLLSLTRLFYFMIAGWPDTETYLADNNCNDADNCDGPPQNGMLGLGADILSGIETILSANGVSSCTSIPTTGSSTGSLEVGDESETATLTFATPVEVIPTGYPGADGSTTYDKRISVSTDGTPLVTVEFSCTRQAGYFSLNFPEAGVATTRIIEFYFDAEEADATKADFYMRYDESYERMFLSLATNSDSTFTYHVGRAAESSDSPGTYDGFRCSGRGNWVTRQTTALFSMTTGKASLDAVASDAIATNTDVTHDMSNGRFLLCVDSSSGTPTATMGSACSGLSLTAPSGAPLIDSSGSMTISWAAQTTGGLADAIWDP